LHFSAPPRIRGEFLLPRRKWQQSNIARALNGRCQAALMRSAYSGQPARDNLAALCHKLPEQAHVFVIDVVNFFHAEFADFFAPEEFASTAAAFATAGAAIWAWTIRPSAAVLPWRWC
jgi:hypothetical protein